MTPHPVQGNNTQNVTAVEKFVKKNACLFDKKQKKGPSLPA